jgi:hypothetical protein
MTCTSSGDRADYPAGAVIRRTGKLASVTLTPLFDAGQLRIAETGFTQPLSHPVMKRAPLISCLPGRSPGVVRESFMATRR